MKEGDMSMSGKVCLVTGATSGIGRATAIELAKLEATILILGRNENRAKRLCAKIRSENPRAKVEYFIADLSSQQDIYTMSNQFKQKYNKLDVLVNNAGAKFVERHTTVDGYERTFALNHMGYFMLTHLLIDRLKAAGSARIINVSSGAHGGNTINFDDLQNEKDYVGKIAYGQSKLANLLFTYELAKRVNGSGVTVNAMAPGGVITNFCRNNGWVSWGKHIVAHILARNLIGPKKAADTVVYLASSLEVDGVTGKYFYNKDAVDSSGASYDGKSAKKLWEISKELVGREYREYVQFN